ncbi:super-infection exclusion protein B [Acinetobacter sp. SwsAc6]|uniref:super-infection exclusion protein B n=1 Tax=Acinetobacter TaxID=469 RepID=UPI000EA2DEE0|nr:MULTISPECIES: super-infection exclusion protein B [Acinetobacter]NWK73041.1 super-infection exclusion protein B [Acinetobacter sp. SwsAc6]RKG50938.1 hypothetical protein D7V68_03310 [Acinetobacter cumulans]
MKLDFSKTNKIFNIFLILLFIVILIDLDPALTYVISIIKTPLLLIYLVSTALILYEFLHKFHGHLNEKNRLKSAHKDIQDALNQLSHDEKYFLSLFTEKQVLELSFDPKNPTIQILLSQKLIIDLNKFEGAKKHYRIHPNVYRYLRTHPKVLY